MDTALRIQILVEAAGARAAMKAVQADMAATATAGTAASSKVAKAWQAMTKVVAGSAAAIRGMGAGLAAAGAGLTGFASKIGAAGKAITQMGREVQWLGRQIEFRLSLPLLALGAISTKMALDVEREFTKLVKVYGDLGMSQEQVNYETTLLREQFIRLSNALGASQKDVMAVAAAWAAAGVSGNALLELVALTVKTAELGEVDLAAATNALIVVMGAYQLTVAELTDAMEILNVVENETAATFPALVTVFEDVGGIAAQAGISIEELAALTAALTPVFGDASEIGGALKSSIARILAPTNEAADALQAAGIATDSLNFANLTAVERFELVASVMKNELAPAQQIVLNRELNQLRQGARTLGLYNDLQSANSVYAKALAAASDETQRAAVFQDELNRVLQSSPGQVDILTTRLQNMAIELGVKLIPFFIALLTLLIEVADWFGRLAPETQKWVAIIAAAVAILGPLMGLLGSLFIVLGGLTKSFSVLLYAIGFTVKGIGLLIGVIGGAGGAGLIAAFAALAVVVGALLIMWGDEIPGAIRTMIGWFGSIIDALNWVAEGFVGLASVIARALQAVINVVAQAVMIVWEWLSWLNPWATHSPSLVSQVQTGMDAIAEAYAKGAADAAASIAQSKQSVEDFTAAIQHLIDAAKEAEAIETEEIITRIDPAVIDDWNNIVAALDEATQLSIALSAAIEEQTAVVEQWEAALADANAEIEAAEDALKGMEEQADAVASEISAIEDALRSLGSVGITGQSDAQNAIFDNEMAQKEVELEIARLKLSGIADDDPALLALQEELDKLQLEGEILKLEFDIEFDPMEKAIDDLLNPGEEMPFEEIIAAIIENQERLAELNIEYGIQNEAIANQKALIEELVAARDAIEGRLETEKAALEALEQQYEENEAAIRAMEQAMKDFLALDPGEPAAVGGGGGGGGGGGPGGLGPPGAFETPFGDLDIDDLNAALDVEAMNAFMDDLENTFGQEFDFSAFSEIGNTLEGIGNAIGNITGPISTFIDVIGDVIGWLREFRVQITAVFAALLLGSTPIGWLIQIFIAIGVAAWNFRDEIAGAFNAVVGFLTTVGTQIMNLLMPVINFIWGLIQSIIGFLGTLAGWFTTVATTVAGWVTTVIGWFGELGAKIQETFQPLIDELKNWSFLWEDTWALISFLIEGIILFFTNVFVPALQGAWDLINIGWDLLWALIDQAWQSIGQPIWDAIVIAADAFMVALGIVWDGIEEAWGVLWGAVQSAWDTVGPPIISAIETAWEGLKTTIDTLWNLAGGIVSLIADGLAGIRTAWETFRDFIKVDWDEVWNAISSAASLIWDGINGAWDSSINAIQTTWDNVSGAVQASWETVTGAISTAWTTMTGAVDTAWDGMKETLQEIIDFLEDVFEGAVSGVSDTIGTIWDGISGLWDSAWGGAKSAITTAINGVIGVVRSLVDKINFVLPGNPVPKPDYLEAGGTVPLMASGGSLPFRRVGSGFEVATPTAIVGEGSSTHPEYVIPTDPKYRSRALMLLQAAGKKLDAYASGGIIPGYGIGFGPFEIPSPSEVVDAVTGIFTEAMADAAKTAIDAGAAIARGAINALPAGPWGMAHSVGHMVIDELVEAGKNLVDDALGIGKDHIADQVVVITGPSGEDQFQFGDQILMGMGGLVKGGRGGVNALIGERNHDELVTPLPAGFDVNDLGGKKEFHFHGDMVFPNMTDGDEIEEFISNLEALIAEKV